MLSVQCLAGPRNTVRARVRVRMVVVNGDSPTGRDWATRMQVKARLVPLGSGLNYARRFRSAGTVRLLQNRRYRPVLQVVTDNVSALAGWRLQLRLIWDRTAPVPDVTRTVRVGFNGGCGLPTGRQGY